MVDTAPFEILPAQGGRTTPLVFASPHSGEVYPADMEAAVCERSLRSAEDAAVDRLIDAGPSEGAVLIAARIGRAYVDLNRAPDDWDPVLIADAPEGAASPKAQAGYGVVPRLAGDGRPLYARRLTLAQAQARVAQVHAPYHAALAGLMTTTRARSGRAVLIDWHSMPARATNGAVDVVLGDRHGTSCDPALTRRLRRLFEAQGLVVGLNHPYAGGYATQVWGRPGEGFEAVQVELSRALYWDEAAAAPSAGWKRCRTAVRRVIAALCADPALG
ncbi:N-formylglutamate amidohydrolase [Brevundimonas naejangsanensis]|uniref:N-formylglutamate amidohydrolase n=1 Tax=Brevundimonas naejangsanensis TaxID=588932 RepID=A0A494RLW9_9CAUL|nr:N-formylglutamate amidohydrolase [Brevundimonas naejangsanensis]AYG94962.1 N-formylglutamate amidohydrolase [Brevundimonas naejangsanensis]